jgi:hypothetical protein
MFDVHFLFTLCMNIAKDKVSFSKKLNALLSRVNFSGQRLG